MTISQERSPDSQPRLTPVSLFICGALILFIILVVTGVLFGSTCPPDCPRRGPQSISMMMSRQIMLSMAQYADDHGGLYPTGRSSTEIFQKLLDDKYVSDPTLFYLKMEGKTPSTGPQLRPENVSWDVTAGASTASPGQLPIVFLTGYRVDYRPGGKALPLPGGLKSLFSTRGIPVSYHDSSAEFLSEGVQPNGTILNFIPQDIDLGSLHYVQLTPDGPLRQP